MRCEFCIYIPARYTWDHVASAHRFHQEDERKYREEVVVRGERREPMYGEVVYPDREHR